ncbi:hypothetical protein RchiOBHm_Chr2g0097831 [Rosa chinensis]|uniref:Uncharacterized protein n=1 Tax=Rosa chinensis TaxID=74649 RepID=A0A2P6RLF6_ROSCH|nr:hypothetical protein RchiOBHm_Chr2g0097831 [Rosa chinensis]
MPLHPMHPPSDTIHSSMKYKSPRWGNAPYFRISSINSLTVLKTLDLQRHLTRKLYV